jgi:zinc transport system substrate-binding protein
MSRNIPGRPSPTSSRGLPARLHSGPWVGLCLALLTGVGFAAWPAWAAPTVLVTVKPVHSLVAGVMAGIGDPALLLPAGATPHSYSLRPSDARKLARADLVIRIGPVLEGFLDRPLANIARRARVITLMRDAKMRLIRHPAQDGPDTHRDNAQLEADPHIWLDPENSRRIVRRVAQALTRLDPDNRARYAANSEQLLARIGRLDRALSTTLAPIRETPYIVFHDGYRYFERYYRLNRVAAITVSPERAPGARRLRRIRDVIRVAGVKCVFTEPQFSPALARALMRGTDARRGILDPLGVAVPPGPDAWFDIMRGLAASLRRCLTDG